nr:hypothetical protein [uncultured Pedobacter sp.]
MITTENRKALKDRCTGHYPEIAQLVAPTPVSAEFVGQVLRGTRDSVAVIRAAKDFLANQLTEAEELNEEVSQLIK